MSLAEPKISAVSPESPWLGLRPFSEDVREYFFGRDAEVRDLFQRVVHKPLTVLFGRSGLGKTSLLQAALVPRLRDAGFLPIVLRLDYADSGEPLLRQFVDALSAALAPALPGLHASLSRLPLEAALPWLLFHDPILGLTSPESPRAVVLLDQFEEIFTLGQATPERQKATVEFLEMLADLVENRVPESLRTRLETDDDLADRLDYAARPVKILVSLREDFLHLLERYRGRMPAIMDNRFELRLLTGAQALEAVTEPGRLRCRLGTDLSPLVSEATGGAIVRFVAGVAPDIPLAEIDAVPPLLSLLCAELNEQRLAAGESVIRPEQLEGRAEDILGQFYERCFAPQPATVRAFVEDRLLSATGFRESTTLDTATHELVLAGLTRAAAVEAVTRLVDARLLTSDERGGVRRIELTHDILTSVARRSRDARIKHEAAARRWRQRARLFGFILGLALLALFSYSFYRQAEMQRALAAEERERLAMEHQQSEQARQQARQQSQALLHVAEKYLASESDPNKDVLALYYLSRALRFDRRNSAVTRRVCELLTQRTWCPALSPVLQLNADSAILCANWDPNGNLIVISRDGQFLRWSGTGHELRAAGSALSQLDLANSAEAAPSLMSAKAAKFSSGFFSPDGQQLLLFSNPAPSKVTTAQIREWSQATGSYGSILQTIEIKDSSQSRKVAWSHDGKTLAIVPETWDYSSCQVFRHDGKLYQEIANPFGNTKVAAACFSEDDKWLATESLEGAVQFWDPATLSSAAESSQVRGSFRLPTNARPRFLAFGPGKNEMTTILVDGSVNILDLRSASTRSGYARDKQITYIGFTPQQAKRRLAATVLRSSIVISNLDALDQPIAEPICLQQGAFSSARFSGDGTKLLTVSGLFWDALDTVRVWDVRLQKPWPASVTLPSASTLAPTWLGDLAAAVSAQWWNLVEEDALSLDALADKYSAKEIDGPFAPIWKRFFPSKH